MATYTETVVQGTTYRDRAPKRAGYTTYVTGSVDTSVVGDYELTYTITRLEPFDRIVETKIVTVTEASGGGSDIDFTDYPAPVVILNGDSFLTIESGDDWEDPGAFANVETSPNVFEDLPVVVTSSVDVWANAESGSYTIMYHAVSKQGRIGYAIRTVTVGVEYRDTTQNTVAPGFTLNGCEKLYVEYPTGTTRPIYVGADYIGVGSHIIKDEGFTLDDPDDPTFVRMSIVVENTSNQVCSLEYSNKTDCEAAGGTWGYLSTFPQTNEVYMEASDTETRTYNIKYTISDIYGNIRTQVRTVVMLHEGANPDELAQQASAAGCLLNDDKIDISDALQDEDVDAGYSVTADATVDDISQYKLDIICAGETAFFGGFGINTRDYHDNEIPETIVETRYVDATDVTGMARLFVNTYDVPLQTGTKEMRSEGTAIWRLHTIHNRNLVTYSLGTGSFRRPTTSDVIFSTFHRTAAGDVFYGRFGTHIFNSSPGWGNSVTQKSIAWSTGRTLSAPASFTEVTQSLTDDWITRVSTTADEAGKYVFKDPNSTSLSNGGVIHSHALFRAFYTASLGGGASNPGDVLSLHWHPSGSQDVTTLCEYNWQPPPPPEPEPPTLNLYCNVPIEAGHPAGISVPSGHVVPYQFYEIKWEENSVYNNPQAHPSVRYNRITIIQAIRLWTLTRVQDDRVSYVHGNTSRDLVNSGTQVTFPGLSGTYTFNKWEHGIGASSGHSQYISNWTGRVSAGGSEYYSLGVRTDLAQEGFYDPWTKEGGGAPSGAVQNDSIRVCV